MREIAYIQAIREALEEEMIRDEKVFLIGENIGLHGGIFGSTRGLLDKLGCQRVRQTPISESAIIGAACGSSMLGLRPVSEVMYFDFIMIAMDQVVNQIANNKIPGYSSAKAAVNNFTQWLATHFAQEYNRRLRVNAIAPGFFLTRQNRYLLLDKDGNLTPRAESIISHVPMGEFGKPEDVVGVCIWLSSDASRFLTEAVIPIDGGFSAYSGV